jgi:L-lactate dehydrogenase complex protein LldG
MEIRVLRKIREALRSTSGLQPPPARGRIETERARLVPRRLARAALLELYCERAAAAGAVVHKAGSLLELQGILRQIVPAAGTAALAGRDELTRRLGEDPSRLLADDCRMLDAGRLSRDELFSLDLALTGIDFGVAETGSIVISASNEGARSISLTAGKHVALVFPDQIGGDLLDWAARAGNHADTPPAGMTIITGPSKTADIEMQLVVGVHGPEELHIIIFGS